MSVLRFPPLVALVTLALACGSSSTSSDLSADGGGHDGSTRPDGAGSDAATGSDTSVEDGNTPSDGGDARDASDGSAADAPASDSSPDGSAFCPVACDPATSFCEASYGPPTQDGSAGTPSYSCQPFNSPCDAGLSCACATVGPFCTCDDTAGDVTVTCPFHP